MRTLTKLLSAPAIIAMIGTGALAISTPALAQNHWHGGGHYYHGGGRHFGGDRHWRGGHWRGWGPNVSFGFYGYPYYDSYYTDYPYYGYDGYYDCDDPYYDDDWSDYCD